MPDMAPTPIPQDVETRARDLLDGRMASVRGLVKSRQTVADLHEQLAEAERADVRAYNAALADGWSAEELKKLGLAEPDKKARVRRRTAGGAAGTNGQASHTEGEPAGSP